MAKKTTVPTPEANATDSGQLSFPYGANVMAKTTKKKTSKKRGTKVVNGINRSELIRQYIEAHPEQKPKQIHAALAKHGVSIGLINAVRAKGKATKKAGKKAGRKVATTTGHENNGHTATEFVSNAFVIGLDKAIGLLEKIKKAVSD